MASRKEYSDEEKVRALAALAAGGGDVSRTARQLGIPRRTLRDWADAARARGSGVGQAVSLPFEPDEDTDGRLTACPTGCDGRLSACTTDRGTGDGGGANARSLPCGPLADDEPDIRKYLEKLLARLGHEVVASASDGNELVERCRAAWPDVVLTDVRMPHLDGPAAVALLRRERPLRAIFMSAHAGHGQAPHLAKPLTQAGVQRALDEAAAALATE